jgi:serine/threonine protein kinase
MTDPNQLLTEICGSAGYMAPEIFKKTGYNEKADIFSLGCLFFNFTTGCFLFSGETEKEIINQNRKCNLLGVINACKHYSRGARDLLS